MRSASSPWVEIDRASTNVRPSRCRGSRQARNSCHQRSPLVAQLSSNSGSRQLKRLHEVLLETKPTFQKRKLAVKLPDTPYFARARKREVLKGVLNERRARGQVHALKPVCPHSVLGCKEREPVKKRYTRSLPRSYGGPSWSGRDTSRVLSWVLCFHG